MPRSNDNYRRAYSVTTFYKSDIMHIINICTNAFPYLVVLIDNHRIKDFDEMRAFERKKISSFIVKGYQDALLQKEMLTLELTKKSAFFSLSNVPHAQILHISSQIHAIFRKRYASLRELSLYITGTLLPFITFPGLDKVFGQYTLFSIPFVSYLIQLVFIIVLLLIQKAIRLTGHVVIYFTDSKNFWMFIPVLIEFTIRIILMEVFAQIVLFILHFSAHMTP
ncbi:MAG TPA: hypothetical protein VNG51_03860 [Ktedonobacteraceae bacterium]|nr:hypothetical protein [Ktedonobacteraceae bacterium]